MDERNPAELQLEFALILDSLDLPPFDFSWSGVTGMCKFQFQAETKLKAFIKVSTIVKEIEQKAPWLRLRKNSVWP